jgi:AcrR family transcriptional regulator
MRRVAAELGVGVMSLYRHVPGKDQLVLLMADAVFGEAQLPVPPPPRWRARLDGADRQDSVGRLDTLFEFGLKLLLDGLAVRIQHPTP